MAVMKNAYTSGAISYLQLHGNESEETIKTLQNMGSNVINVVHHASNLKSIADYVMLDSSNGLGITPDWHHLPAIHRPWILAGGLTNTNIAEAVALTHPSIVDVSSGVETDGIKDLHKITEIINTAHNLQ
ncbi:phosphoribosylanthranilate isomerase [Weissella beninensis]|nr:phosphoribosylanthranilate isomerase [Periweissella beninensis]